MNNHYCIANHITDLLACQECGVNQICCKQCFSIKHRQQKGPIHQSCKLVDSSVYKNFLKLIHVQWLVGQKVLKSLGGFQLANTQTKTYLVNTAFYGSQFYKQFFNDQQSAQQYLILKCYYSGDPKSFNSLSSIQKLLNQAKSIDMINKYITKLTQPSEQQKVMNSHIDFYTGADIYYLGQFFSSQQQIFLEYLNDLNNKNQEFTIYKYIEWRQKSSGKERDSIYYSNQFTAFLVEYYRKDADQKEIFTLTDYILNYWQFFHTAVQINPILKQFIQSEIQFYTQYEKLMQESSLNITYLGYKIWKLNNGISKQLPYLKNHYFLYGFVEGYLKMKIQRTYVFLTQQQKETYNKQGWAEFVKYIKDFSLYLQSKNKQVKQEDKKIFNFEDYKIYYLYRRRLQPFHDKLKASKQNIYDKQIALQFFNHHFQTNIQLKPKLYKQFFQKYEQNKQKEEQKQTKLAQQLKQQLMNQEKQNFYQFIYINFINYCKQQQIKVKKNKYFIFKKAAFQSMDQDYIKLTQQKFKRGDFNQQPEEQVTQEVQSKPEQPKVIIGQTGAKITVGMDKYEEEILQDNINQDEQSQGEQGLCQCCNGDIYNCENAECQVMGYCTQCMQ